MRNLSRLLLLVTLATAACHKSSPPAEEQKKDTTPRPDPLAPPKEPVATSPKAPKGIPFDPPPSADNPWTAEKAALGKQLFFDKRLSKDGSASCESCHYQDKGWTDNLPFSTKVGGEVNTRNTPSLYNVGYQNAFYWDGRAPSLEANVAAAWKGQLGADPTVVATTIDAIPGYHDAFQKAFGGPASADTIAKALAAYLRTIVSGDSAWDRYEAGDKSAVSADAIAGYTIFTTKAQCVLCHVPPLYTDGLFHNIGIEAGKANPDLGRFKVTNNAQDTSAFKTPSLRAAAHSQPYFQDASAATLEDAVKFMAGGGKPEPHLDQRHKPANLSDAEIKQVVAFLQALGDTPDKLEKPTLP
jgi:cytochrome c peroxidase